ncbi:hypothetical protein [Flavobacterium alkalisoli]|uniref:hypothetical protein n=1 Tax=Flavobacterium alkalisoli TaxID=2602769 RepID=UPI003A92D1EE
MKKTLSIKLLAFLGFIFLVTSCAKPKFSNLIRGKYKYDNTTLKNDVLKVNVSILPVSKPAGEEEKLIMMTDLRDSLPHLYMKLLSEKENNAEKFIELLKKPLSDKKNGTPGPGKTNYDEYQVLFVFSNIKQYFNDGRLMHPNTRLEFLNTTLSLDSSSKFYFYNINKLENEFEEIDLGTAERTKDVKFESKLTASNSIGFSNSNTTTDSSDTSKEKNNSSVKNVYDEDGNLLGSIGRGGNITTSGSSGSENTNSQEGSLGYGGEVGYINGESIKEAVAVKLKRMKTGFSLSPNNLTISQRARPMGDISDNVYVTVTLKIKSEGLNTDNCYLASNLYTDAGVINAASAIKIQERPVAYISCENDDNLSFTMNYSGALRAVTTKALRFENSNNAMEYDDKVTFYKLPESNTVQVKIDENSFCSRVYGVTCKLKNDDTLYTLYINNTGTEALHFFSEHNYQLFFKWITEVLTDPKTENLQATGFDMFFMDNNRTRQIKVIDNVINNTDIELLKKLDLSTLQLVTITP